MEASAIEVKAMTFDHIIEIEEIELADGTILMVNASEKTKKAAKREADLQARAYACGSPRITISAIKAQEAYNLKKLGKKTVR